MRVLASKRVADEEKQSKRRIRNYSFAAMGAVAVVAVIFAMLGIAAAKERETLETLLRVATINGRNAPMGAAFAAAHGTMVAHDMHLYELWKEQDQRSHQLLANIVAGLPRKTTFASAAAADIQTNGTSIPLPKLVGFANIDGNQVKMVEGVDAGEGRHVNYIVPQMHDSAKTVWSAGEPEAGTVILLQSSLPSAALDGEKSIERVYVLTRNTKGENLAPLSVDYFRQKTTTEAPKAPPAKRKAFRAQLPNEFVSLDLSGSVVVLSVIKSTNGSSRADMSIASFVFDPQAPRTDPFKLAMQHEFHIDLTAIDTVGFNEPLLLDGYMVVPVALEPSQGRASTDVWGVRYDLRTGSRLPLKKFDALTQCKSNGCGWELIRRDAADNLIVFAKAKAGGPRAGTRGQQSPAERDVEQFERFVVFDVLADHAFYIDTQWLRNVRKACSSGFGTNELGGARKRSASRLFVTGDKGALLFGLQTDRSVDLVKFSNVNGINSATCVGILLDAGDVDAWRTAWNGNTLLATSPSFGLSWDVSETTESRARKILQRGPVAAACDQGLRGHEGPDDELTSSVTMYLGAQRRKLCDGPGNVVEAKQRAAVQFPAVDVTTKGDLPSALKK